MAIALERQDVRREAIEEEAVVADDHGAARAIFERFFERRERFGVEIVGRFVEQQDVAALFQPLRHMDAIALAARELAALLLLFAALAALKSVLWGTRLPVRGTSGGRGPHQKKK